MGGGPSSAPSVLIAHLLGCAMKLKPLSSFICLLCLLICSPIFCFAARKYGYEDDHHLTFRQIKDSIEDLRHELSNHEIEIRRYEEKLLNQESIIDGLRRNIHDTSSAQQFKSNEAALTLESKLSSLENTTKGLVSDLKQFKTHAQETHQAMALQKQKLEQVEKYQQHLTSQIESLQTALKSLMEAFSNKGEPQVYEQSGRNYKVKAGDSLEKIAKNHQTTVQALKELNQLTHDKIRVNQILQIPSS